MSLSRPSKNKTNRVCTQFLINFSLIPRAQKAKQKPRLLTFRTDNDPGSLKRFRVYLPKVRDISAADLNELCVPTQKQPPLTELIFRLHL